MYLTGSAGPVPIDEAGLAELVAEQLRVPHVTVLTSSTEAHPYDRPAITTASRHLVTGTAATPDGRTGAFGFFVKVVHAFRRSPLRFAIPEELWTEAEAVTPWRTEADIYRSDLPQRLPPGLSTPRCHAVRDFDEESTAIWLERVPVRRVTWDIDRRSRAAFLLGRFAASADVVSVATSVHGARTPRVYARGWLDGVVRPAFSDNGLWTHPLVRDAFDPALRRRLEATFDALPALLDELDDAPPAAAHGDACPANLLVAADRPGFVMVDFGFCGRAPLGMDLLQLVLAEVQAGHQPVADLPALDAACADAYLAGLRAEGCRTDPARLRRVRALLMTVFAALPAVPVEHLADQVTPALHRAARARAAVACFALDLLDVSRPGGGRGRWHAAVVRRGR